MPDIGYIVNQGASIALVATGVVNITITQDVTDTCLTIYARKIEFSNTADFAVLVTPSAGTVDLFYGDGSHYNSFRAGRNLVAGSTVLYTPMTTGNVHNVRVITAGITGANFVRVTFDCHFTYDPNIDPRVYTGLQAFTVQSFTEVNSKNGTQYEASSRVLNLANGANIDTLFTTGNNPVLVKSRKISYNGTSFVARVYSGTTYTGGTIIPYFNLNNRNPVAGTVVIRGGATITGVGTEIATPTYGVGSDGQGSRAVASFSDIGIERVLASNTTYLLRITNDSGAAQNIAAYLTWYEGPISSEI